MRSFLLSACPVLVWIITLIHLVFLVVAFRQYARMKKPLFLLSGLIVLGLFYDALILSLGSILPDGTLLRTLSRLRFVFHGALIPLIFPICAYALDFSKTWKTIVWVFTGILIALGIAEGFATDLSLQQVAGILRYTS